MYCYQLNDEGSQVAKNCGQALGAESRLLLTASKEKGTSVYHCTQLLTTRMSLGADFSQEPPA